MPVDIRYAGLEADVERRVNFAVNGLAAHRITATASAWDGTRCDLLITDAEDTYGRVAIDRARRRNTSILAFTDDISRPDTWATWLRRDATVATLTKMVAEVLSVDGASAPTAATPIRLPDSIAGAPSGLVHLATKLGMQRVRAVLTFRDKKLLADPISGRLYAATHVGMQMAPDLLTGFDWHFTKANGTGIPAGMTHSTSLDSTYVESALRRRANLPDFPLRDVWLCDWPDLGQAPSAISALQVVRSLLRGKTDGSSITSATGVPAADVNACLWAFAASGLLHHASLGNNVEPLMQTTIKSRFSNLVTRMARHFGLSESGK